MEEDVEINQLLKCNENLLNEAVKSTFDNSNNEVARPSTSKQYLAGSKNKEIDYDEEVQELLDHQYINLSYIKSENSEDGFEEESDSTINEILGGSKPKNQNAQKLNISNENQVIEQLNSAKELLLKKSSFLLDFGEALQNELMENENKQRAIRSEIYLLSKKNNKPIHDINENRLFFKKFGTPYFKDIHGFFSPINEDQQRKIERKEINISSLPTTSFWTKCDKLKLMDAIKDNIIQDKSHKLVNEINKLKEALEDSKNSEKKDLGSKIIEKQNELESLKNKSYSTLILGENPDREFDWMKISYKYFTDIHSPEECRRYYNLFLKPTVNREFWKPDEDKALLKLAQKYNYQDWDRISKELGTNRSAYHCFVRHQTQLQGEKRCYQGKWTKEEDNELLSIVNQSLIGGFIPWSKISAHVTNRTHGQIYNRWRQSLNPNIVKGKFTQEEDVFIMSGMQIFNSTYKELSYIMKNRTSSQIRDRYERNLLNKKSKLGAWSLEEDEQLLRLVQTHGKSNWSTISKSIKNRTRTQVRQRYSMILRLMENRKGWNINTARRQVTNNTFDKTGDAIKKKVDRIKKEFIQAEKDLKLSDVEKEKFRFESLKRLKDIIFAKKFKSKRKKLVLSDHSNGNNQLLEYFRNSATCPIKNASYPDSSNVNHYFNDILLMAKYFQVNIKLPQDENEIRNNMRLDKRLKIFLCDVIKKTDLIREDLNNDKNYTIQDPLVEINIDYIAPEFDDTILMNEWWHTSPTDVSQLNFSEFFKRTVFDYSNGMHHDIWTDKCRRLEVPVYDQIHQPTIDSNLHKMYVNPNSFTLQGFRSILLSRGRLKHTSVGRDLADIIDSSVTEKQSEIHLSIDPVEQSKFQQTLLALFTWPKALSLMNDHSIWLGLLKNKLKCASSYRKGYCPKSINVDEHTGILEFISNIEGVNSLMSKDSQNPSGVSRNNKTLTKMNKRQIQRQGSRGMKDSSVPNNESLEPSNFVLKCTNKTYMNSRKTVVVSDLNEQCDSQANESAIKETNNKYNDVIGISSQSNVHVLSMDLRYTSSNNKRITHEKDKHNGSLDCHTELDESDLNISMSTQVNSRQLRKRILRNGEVTGSSINTKLKKSKD